MSPPPGHFTTPLDNMIAAVSRLAAILIEGESSAAVEMRWDRDLFQTTMVQQQAYSYSRDRIHSTPRPSKSYSRHIEEPDVSSSVQNPDTPRRPNLARGGANARDVVDNGRARREAESAAHIAAQYENHQTASVRPTTSVQRGMAFSSWGVPCLTQALRNVRLPKDFRGPRKVPNYIADLPPEALVESYEMAMEMLDVDEVACVKYFTMMLD